MRTFPDLTEHVDHFRYRVLQDCLAEATAAYWNRRAESFERAIPRPGDFVGSATPEDVEARRMRLAGMALACRQRAALSLIGGPAA